MENALATFLDHADNAYDEGNISLAQLFGFCLSEQMPAAVFHESKHIVIKSINSGLLGVVVFSP